MIVYIDIETRPDWTRGELFLPELQRKIQEETFADEADPEIIQAQVEMRASLTPEFLQIVGLNIAIGENEPKSGWVGDISTDGELITEESLLRTFWKLAEHADHIVGFNCLRFDIPAILVRSAILGVFPTVPFFAQRPWESTILDLAQKRVQFGRFEKGQWHSLKALRRLYNLPIPEDLQDVALMDGGDVGTLYQEWQDGLRRANEEAEGSDPVAAEIALEEANNALDTLKKYGRLDIWTTKALCQFWQGYFFPMITAPLQREASDE